MSEYQKRQLNSQSGSLETGMIVVTEEDLVLVNNEPVKFNPKIMVINGQRIDTCDAGCKGCLVTACYDLDLWRSRQDD